MQIDMGLALMVAASGAQHPAGQPSSAARRSQRVRLRSPVQLSDERGLRGSGVTRDISAGGAFVSTGAACAVGERLSLALMLPGARGRRRVTAVVKWRREPNPFMRMEGDDEGVGVAFVDGGPSLRALACLGKRPARKAHGRRG